MSKRENGRRRDEGPAELQLYDVAIVGAGAAGAGCAAALKEFGVVDDDMIILDRHEVGASFRRWPQEMRFITPSFTSNAIGLLDLNAIVPGTSPAYSLDRDHHWARTRAVVREQASRATVCLRRRGHRHRRLGLSRVRRVTIPHHFLCRNAWK